jgi:SAM-dependent methyltransferase
MDFSAAVLAKLTNTCATDGRTTVRTAVMDGPSPCTDGCLLRRRGIALRADVFPDHDRGVRELLRVLKLGGQAVITTWAPPPRGEMLHLMGSAAARAKLDVPAPHRPPHRAERGDDADLRQRLVAVGFARAHVMSVTRLWSSASPEWLVELMPSVAPSSAELFTALTVAQREAFARAVVEDVRGRQGDGPFGVTHEGLIAIGTKAG